MKIHDLLMNVYTGTLVQIVEDLHKQLQDYKETVIELDDSDRESMVRLEELLKDILPMAVSYNSWNDEVIAIGNSYEWFETKLAEYKEINEKKIKSAG